jgi:hypothetical protein
MAGWERIIGFKNQNPDICLRKLEATSAAQNMSFSEPQVTAFLASGNSIFNVYEDIPKKPITY